MTSLLSTVGAWYAGTILAAVSAHADAVLPHVSGSDYMVEHWLAAYAVLYLDA